MSALQKLGLGTEKYPALTGVRAVGASVVFFDHAPLVPHAHVVINVMAFFYALSGFLIVRIYHEQAQLQWAWLKKYFVNRFARIYPVYCLLLTMVVLLHHDVRPVTLLTNYTLTHALFHGSTRLIEPSWSLTVEETFYFLAPVFMVLSKRFGFLAPFALGWLLFAGSLAISTLGFSFLGTPAFVLSTTFFGHFFEFFAGFYLALLVMRTEQGGTLHARGSRRTAIGLCTVAVLIVAMMLVYGRAPLDVRAVVMINNFLIPVPIVLLYWGLIRENTWLSQWLSTPLAGLLGRSSYSFYLLQGVVIGAFKTLSPLPPAGTLLLFGLTWAASVALFVAFEEPLNVRIRRRFRSQDQGVGMRATLFRS